MFVVVDVGIVYLMASERAADGRPQLVKMKLRNVGGGLVVMMVMLGLLPV